jgi:glycosyltransferase involved in cell wall biosynthesis
MSREALYREVYPRADLFLYPTRFDCAPLVVMEALAHGLPVVAPAAFALPELVRDGETGFLFEPGDEAGAAAAVERLLADQGLRARFGTAARADFDRRLSAARRNAVLKQAYMEAAA